MREESFAIERSFFLAFLSFLPFLSLASFLPFFPRALACSSNAARSRSSFSLLTASLSSGVNPFGLSPPILDLRSELKRA